MIRLGLLASVITEPLWNNIYNTFFISMFTYDQYCLTSRKKIDSGIIKVNISTRERFHMVLRVNSIEAQVYSTNSNIVDRYAYLI